MKTLLLLRHAKSSWKEPGRDDHDRPLNARGKRDAPRMGRLIRTLDLIPDRVLCSTARRARDTCDRLREAIGADLAIEHVEELYHAHPADIAGALARAGGAADTVLIVGHNPGLELVVHALTGDHVTMPTAALVRIDLDVTTWTDDLTSQGDLAGTWLPRELD